jgi:hypothetical protein
MWLLRRKTAVSETSGEVLPAATGPMRRIEITVERRWISRVSRSVPEDGAEAADGGEQTLGLAKSPDG